MILFRFIVPVLSWKMLPRILRDLTVGLWIWVIDFWEISVLFISGFHPAKRLFERVVNSSDVHEIISTCLSMYRRSVINGTRDVHREQVKDLLTGVTARSIITTTTDCGYNLLQLAVINHDLDMLEYLLTVKQCNPNFAKCSHPLHIAILQGHRDTLEMLLANQAKPYKQMGMCYPEPHVPCYNSHSKFFFVSDSMVCGGRTRDAYQLAIEQKNVEVLDILLEQKSFKRIINGLLHYACEEAAVNCIRLLVGKWGADVNAVDNKGCNSLMHSLHSIDVINCLISLEAEPTIMTYKSQTVLHKLCKHRPITIDLANKLRLFLALGADNDVDLLDVFRNSALSYLMVQLRLAADLRERTIIQEAIGMLTKHNAEIMQPDQSGILPISRLLDFSLPAHCIGDMETGIKLSQGSDSPASTEIPPSIVEDVIALFCATSPSCVNDPIDQHGHTAIYYVVSTSFKTRKLTYLDVIPLMQKYGADINHVIITQTDKLKFPPSDHGQNVVSILREYMVKELSSISESRPGHATPEASHAAAVVERLLTYGLNPNITSSRCRNDEEVEHINLLSATSSLICSSHSKSQLNLIYNWLKLVLLWGGNPELETHTGTEEIRTSHSGIFLSRQSTLPAKYCLRDTCTQLWTENTDEMMAILKLYFHTMSKKNFDFIIVSSHIINLKPHIRKLLVKVFDLDQPRTLQASSRYCVYASIGRNIAANANLLPLPENIKDSILLND